MPRAICWFLGVIVLLVLTGSGDAKADAARGRILAEEACSQCHGVGPNQSSANPKAPSFSAIAAEPSITEYSVRVFLRTPHATMPNLMIKPDDIDDIVSYLLSLKPSK